jgi:hypothetical protein
MWYWHKKGKKEEETETNRSHVLSSRRPYRNIYCINSKTAGLCKWPILSWLLTPPLSKILCRVQKSPATKHFDLEKNWINSTLSCTTSQVHFRTVVPTWLISGQFRVWFSRRLPAILTDISWLLQPSKQMLINFFNRPLPLHYKCFHKLFTINTPFYAT